MRMETVEHTLVLRGPDVGGGKPKPESLGLILRLIEPAVRGSVSMGFRNSSIMPGRRPVWFQRASDIRLVAISRGEDDATELHFEAPCFGDAAEDLYRQGELFQVRPDENDTGFDLFGDVLNDIRAEQRDSFRFDAGLLQRVGRFARSPSRNGVKSIAISGRRHSPASPALLDAKTCEMAEAMRQSTPPARRARIAGKLDMIRASDSVFELLLEGTSTVRGIWKAGKIDELQALFSKEVVMEGQAVYRVSGGLLRLEAEAIRTATPQDSFFRQIPKPVRGTPGKKTMFVVQTPRTGAAAVFDHWPGDEPEEELLEDLRSMG